MSEIIADLHKDKAVAGAQINHTRTAVVAFSVSVHAAAFGVGIKSQQC